MPTFSVVIAATLNCRYANALPKAYGGASVIAYQEVENRNPLRVLRWNRAFRKLIGWAQYVHDGAGAKAVRITWDTAIWEFVSGGGKRAHLGKKGVSPHRWSTWVVLRHRETGELVRFVCTHRVSGVRGKGKPPVEWRRRSWQAHQAMDSRLVAGWVGDGENAVTLGDYNRPPADGDGPGVELAPLRLVAHSRPADNGAIDQIWSNLTSTGARVGDKHGSDHWIVFTRLSIGATPPKPPKPDPEVKVPSAAEVIRIAQSQIGVHEGRSNGHWNNDQRYSDEVPGFKWSDGQPWCDTFVAWCAWKAGMTEAQWPRSASCDASGDAFKRMGRWSEYPAVGAQVLFGTPRDLSHTGIVTAYDDTYIWTVEGNTNASGSREGDGVYAKQHRRRDDRVVGYGYPRYPEGIKSADPKWQRDNPKPPKPEPTVKPAKDRAADLIAAILREKNVTRPGVVELIKAASADVRAGKVKPR